MKSSRIICGILISCILGLSLSSGTSVFAAAANFTEPVNKQAPVVEWQVFLDSSKLDWINDMQKTDDGGYILAGYTKVEASSKNNRDVQYLCITKLNDKGEMQWENCMDNAGFESEANSIQQTKDGGYIAAGSKGSFTDLFIVKFDGKGKIVWQKSLGGSNFDEAESIQQSGDGGYIAAGYTWSNNGDVKNNHSNAKDFWVIKLDDKGKVQWQKCLGGKGYDVANSIRQTSDGGYIAAGYTNSNNGDVKGIHGEFDGWVVKLDDKGKIQWQKCLGDKKEDEVVGVRQTADGGYIVAMNTEVENDGEDCQIVKLGGKGEIEWQKCYGGRGFQNVHDIKQTMDGGYIAAGITVDSDLKGYGGNQDYWIIKLDNKGELEWQKCLGGEYSEFAAGIEESNDGGYIVSGTASSIWIVKLGYNVTKDDALLTSFNLKHNRAFIEQTASSDLKKYLVLDGMDEYKDVVNLAKDITAGKNSDYDKLSAIYDWIAGNIRYDTEIKLIREKTASEYHPYNVIKDRKAVFPGYAALFKYLCRLVKIPCRVIEGRRGTYEGEVHPRLLAHNHEWNEAYIDGRWVIADVMLDQYNRYENGQYRAGGVNPERKHFDPSIEQFSVDHLYLREQQASLVWEKVEVVDESKGKGQIIIGELPTETIKRLQKYPFTYDVETGFEKYTEQKPEEAKLVIENLSKVLNLYDNEEFFTNEKLFCECRGGYMARGVLQVRNKNGTMTEQDLEVRYFYGQSYGDPRLEVKWHLLEKKYLNKGN